MSVTTTGTINPATGNHSQGLYNGDGTHSGTSPTGGGVANVTNSTFVTKGVDSIGVDTLDGGTTTLSGGSISTSGAGSNAIQTSSDAKTTVNVGPSGPTSISTTGNASYGVGSDGGGLTTLVGAIISTTGNGSGGLAVNGAGSEIDATNVSITTTGAYNSSSGQHSYGAYNGPSGSVHDRRRHEADRHVDLHTGRPDVRRLHRRWRDDDDSRRLDRDGGLACQRS